MYRIVKKQALNPTVTLMVIDAPFVARKALPGQFIILRVDEDGERIPLTAVSYTHLDVYKRQPIYTVSLFVSVSNTTEVISFKAHLLLMIPNCVEKYLSSTIYCDLIRSETTMTSPAALTRMRKGYFSQSLKTWSPAFSKIRQTEIAMAAMQRLSLIHIFYFEKAIELSDAENVDYVRALEALEEKYGAKPALVMECEPVKEEDYCFIQGSVANILYENTNLEFTAAAFIKEQRCV